jgi:hypothetical protein
MADDMTPAEIEYVRAKAAGITDVARLQTLRENETNFPPFPGGRPSALAVFDARIAELNAQPKQEG